MWTQYLEVTAVRPSIKRAAQLFSGMLLVLALASPSFAGSGGYSYSGYYNSPTFTYVGGYHHRRYNRGYWSRHYPGYYSSRYYYRPYYPYSYYRPYAAYPYPYYPAPGFSFFFRF